MNFNSVKTVAVIAAFSVAFVACENTQPRQSTTVERVLMARNIVNAPYSRILVVGATPRRETARQIEEGLGQELARRNVEVHSFVRESSAPEPSAESVRALVQEKNIDGVIVVSPQYEGAALRRRDEQVDVRAEVRRGGGLLDFFRYDYKELTQPGYANYTFDVRLISDFYDAETNNRIYSLQSSTVHGQTSYEIIIAESKAIVSRLRQDGLIE